MKYFQTISITLFLFSFYMASCNKEDINRDAQNNTKIISNKMKITVGTTVFTATLINNATANAFK